MSKRFLIYLGITAAILVVFLLLWLLGQSTPDNQPLLIAPAGQGPVEPVRSEREVTLYFASPDATHLIGTTAHISCGDEQGCLREVVEGLIRGPGAEGLAVLPVRTRLQNLQVKDDLVVLDFDAQLTEGHPGGSQSELLTVYALANSIAVNFSHLRQVQIMIDGRVARRRSVWFG